MDNEMKMSFELLKERIVRISRDLQQQASDQILASDYTSSQKTIIKIEKMNGFKEKIDYLVKEWELIENDVGNRLDEFSQTKISKEEQKRSEDYPVNSIKKITIAKEGEKKTDQTYDLDYHLAGTTRQATELFHAIRRKIKAMAPNMKEEYNKMYISFVDTQKFCEIHVQKNQLKIWLPPAIELLNDPRKRCKDVRKIGHYGTGATQLFLWRISDVEDVFNLIWQSYNLMKDYR